MQNDPYPGYEPPQPQRRSYTADDLGYPQGGKGILKNPLVATLVLLVTAGLFAGVIMYALSGDDAQEVVPVIQADNSPVKIAPDDPGGADIPHRDSTIFTEMRDEDGDGEIGQIENLLSIDAPYETVDSSAPSDAAIDVNQKPAEDSEAAPEKPAAMYKAGSAPDTIEFVKSVIEKQEEEAPAEQAAAAAEAVKAEPAAGAAVAASQEIATAGTHFVQLSSITDESLASKEWAKLQKKYPSLAGASYRVQKKDLGEKGVFYRIQAGPFSKDIASGKCEMIKAAAGGCFLVAK